MRSLLPRRTALAVCGLALALALLGGTASGAQDAEEELSDILEGVGSAEVVEDADEASGTGSVYGRVYDGTTGAPLSGASVILQWPDPGDGSEPRQEVQVTEIDGSYEFPSVADGAYTLTFIKAGYRASTMTGFEVSEDGDNVADFPLPPVETAAGEDVLELDAFVVEASVVDEMMASLELRMDSDQMLNIMSAEDLSKFAASDVADALKRVSGVNVVEGRFAVIRGLEDRYSSTTFNGAPVPSSDPLRQSVQLDLFPSDVVTGLVIAKTFEAATPGNSGAGSVDIVTTDYPEELTIKLATGGGWTGNALDEFAGYQKNSPIADFQDSEDAIESDYGGMVGGRWNLLGREFRAKFIGAHEVDYETALGWVHGREPSLPRCQGGRSPTPCQNIPGAIRVLESGGLAEGRLDVSDGLFDYTLSEREEQLTFFGGLGIDLDPAGEHRIDLTAFYTKKEIEAVERLDDGVIFPFDYAGTPVASFQRPSTLYGAGLRNGEAVATAGNLLSDFREDPEQLDNGPLSIDPIVRGQSVVQDRTLSVYQLNGAHDLDVLLDGLRFDWAANHARTLQDETSFRMRYWYEPYAAVDFDQNDLPVPVTFPPQESDFPVAVFGPGSWRTNTQDIIFNENEVDETQWFGRGDLGYELEATDWLALEAGAGFWIERAERTLEFTDFQGDPATPGNPGVLGANLVEGPLELQLGPNVYGGYGLGELAFSESEFEREITAGAFHLKGTFWEDFDLVGGVRLEQIYLLSENRPFSGLCENPMGLPPVPPDPSKSGDCPPGYLPQIFPRRYLYLDRQDNPANPFFSEDPRFARLGNADEILGISLPLAANGFFDLLTPEDQLEVLTGEIDEFKLLPAVTLAYRPLDGLTLRGAYSETTARPSFRELGYYATIVPGEDDRLVGNPFLQLSDVTSYDARAEYVWGDFGDLFAISFFYKEIDNPIEVVQLYDFSVSADAPLFFGPFRVYRNNENQADLLGGEAEARLTLGTLSRLAGGGGIDWLEILDYLSIGGNFTYIDAKVKRSEFERSFGDLYYYVAGDDPRLPPTGGSLPRQRRLFNQPEWIVNADVSLDHPEWGTRLTLSYFAISDVLRSAGASSVVGGGQTRGFSLDEYTASFDQLDLVASQAFEVPWVKGTFSLKGSVKNLTDSPRGIVYDEEVIGNERERRLKIGRDYSFGLGYELVFGGE